MYRKSRSVINILFGIALFMGAQQSALAQLGGLGDVVDVIKREVKKPKAPKAKPAPAPASTGQKNSNAGKPSGEPVPGTYRITFSPRSKLTPSDRIQHNSGQTPIYHPQWVKNYDNFVAPSATIRYADGPRSVIMKVHYGHSTFESDPMYFRRVLSNPYIPTDRVDVPNPNWVISPYYGQGFFNEISEFSCRPDGSLFVKGKVGVAADFNHESWARGIWRVQPDGQVIPFEVFPDSSYLEGGKHSCDVRTCGLPQSAPRDRALADGSRDWVEDKHGNVWGIRGYLNWDSGKGPAPTCQIKRYNSDGSDTLIKGHQELCETPKGVSRDFESSPNLIVYDETRDEVVVAAGKFGGNVDGGLALLRIDQAGRVTEMLRNWAHREGSFGPNPPGKSRTNFNQVNDKWWSITNLVFHRASGAVRFEVSLYNQMNYPGRVYEIRDTFKTLKLLPFSTPGQVESTSVYGRTNDGGKLYGDDQKLGSDRTSSELISYPFWNSCYDDGGNHFFHNGSSIRKMTPQGKFSTWVK